MLQNQIFRLGRFPLAILLLCVLLGSPAVAQHEGIRWQRDIEAAKAEALRTGRFVLVHFWTPQCGPCRKLDKNVFNQPGMASAIDAKFVPVKLNANEFPATAEGFGITRVPTDLILSPQGQVIGKLVSPGTPSAYIAEVTQVANKYASQSGQAYKAAVANVEQPLMNSAYAQLPLRVSTVPVSPTMPLLTPTAPQVVQNQHLQNPQAVAASVPKAPAVSTPTSTPTPVQVANRYAIQPAPSAVVAPITPITPVQQATVANTVVNPSTSAPTQPQNVAATAEPNARQLPPGAPPLGFEGYCPVSMRSEWQWVAGDPKWGAIHRGRTFWIVSQEKQQKFLANPDY